MTCDKCDRELPVAPGVTIADISRFPKWKEDNK